MTVYAPWNDGLGDHWATCSLLRWKAMASGTLSRLSLHGLSPDQRLRLREINPLLDRSDLVALVEDPADARLDGFDVWASPVVPTARPWSWPACEKVAAFHWEGFSSAKEKNVPLGVGEAIIRWLASRGVTCIDLDRPRKSLADVVEILAKSLLFVGCDSGFSHMAHSVGTPCFLYEHQHPVITCHRQKQHVIVRSAADFESQARMLVDLHERLNP